MAKFLQALTVVLVGLLAFSRAQVSLEGYNVDPNSITVSGLSAGGAMATQFHFAFSANVSGVGVFAGVPYTCAKAGLSGATSCMNMPGFYAPLTELISHTESLASAGSIDPLSNIRDSRVYVFHGTVDSTVKRENGEKIRDMYQNFGANLKVKLDMGAQHGHPTDFYGAACSMSSSGTQYINNCNYNGAFEMFDHLYGGGLIEPDTSINPAGELIEFAQSDFTSGLPSAISMDTIGFAYIPTGCRDRTTTCKLHIAFHGCVQSRSNVGVGNKYATNSGYTHAAEVNNIIVLFPQAVAKALTNPNACFDWWGYLNANFLTQQGAQMKAVQAMIERVLDCPDCEPSNPSTTTTTTEDPGSGSCKPNEVEFSPSPAGCDYYNLCACGGDPILLQCAQGLFYDDVIKGCNFMQLVDCENGKRPAKY